VNLGVVSLAYGDLDTAEASLGEALDVARLGDATPAYVDALSQLALLEAAGGRLRRAGELGTEAIELASRRGRSSSPHTTAAYLALGWAHYHWAEPDDADAHLALASSSARETGDRPAQGLSSLLSLYCLAARGPAGASQAVRLLHGALAQLDGLRLPPHFAGLAAAAPPAILAARGDLDAAQAALDDAPPDALEVRVVGARIAFTRGDLEQAHALLDAAVASPASRVAEVEAWVLRALAEGQQRERGAARASLEHALELGGPEHYRRAFLAAGPAARAALVELIREGTAHRSFVAELLAAFDERAPRIGLTAAEVLEPLSEREKAILRYLPTMMSNVEIAAELFLSINTVKTHLRHVYRKLGVTRRRDAVERARELSLL
jgi:LuxR family maltose regulon positive regulatory protein